MSYDINWIPKKEINHKRVSELLKESERLGQFTNNGPNVKLLEETTRVKLKIDDSKAVICVANGTVALHALVAAINLDSGKTLKWATQSFTFPSSAQGILSDAAILDIDEEGGLDLNLVADDIDGIIVTNVFGNLVNIDKYTEWADKNDKILLFDNAATAYSFYKGKNAVNYGVGCIISFHHTKPIGFGEGGAIIVDNKFEKAIRRIINFGIDNTVINSNWLPNGSNFKMSDVSAVYILQFMDNFAHIVFQTCVMYEEYKKLIDDEVKFFPNFSDGTPFVSCICLLHSKFTHKKIDEILGKKIFCRKYYNPLKNTPISQLIYNKIICLPCHYKVSIGDIKNITDNL